MRVILNLEKEVLDILKSIADSDKRSRKQLMELTLVELADKRKGDRVVLKNKEGKKEKEVPSNFMEGMRKRKLGI